MAENPNHFCQNVDFFINTRLFASAECLKRVKIQEMKDLKSKTKTSKTKTSKAKTSKTKTSKANAINIFQRKAMFSFFP